MVQKFGQLKKKERKEKINRDRNGIFDKNKQKLNEGSNYRGIYSGTNGSTV